MYLIIKIAVFSFFSTEFRIHTTFVYTFIKNIRQNTVHVQGYFV